MLFRSGIDQRQRYEAIRKLMGERFLGRELLEESWPKNGSGGGVTGIPAFPESITEERIRRAGVNHVLVCVPERINGKEVTIMNLKRGLWGEAKSSQAKEKFYHDNNPWYANEGFANRVVPSGWYLVRTDVPEVTRGKSYEEVERNDLIDKFKREGYRMIDAPTAVFSMVMFNSSTGRNNMLNWEENNGTWCIDQTDQKWLKWDDNGSLCSDQIFEAYRVQVAFHEYGLDISLSSDDCDDDYIGCGLVLDLGR